MNSFHRGQKFEFESSFKFFLLYKEIYDGRCEKFKFLFDTPRVNKM